MEKVASVIYTPSLKIESSPGRVTVNENVEEKKNENQERPTRESHFRREKERDLHRFQCYFRQSPPYDSVFGIA